MVCLVTTAIRRVSLYCEGELPQNERVSPAVRKCIHMYISSYIVYIHVRAMFAYDIEVAWIAEEHTSLTVSPYYKLTYEKWIGSSFLRITSTTVSVKTFQAIISSSGQNKTELPELTLFSTDGWDMAISFQNWTDFEIYFLSTLRKQQNFLGLFSKQNCDTYADVDTFLSLISNRPNPTNPEPKNFSPLELC